MRASKSLVRSAGTAACRSLGLTLIELLVALSMVALITALAWRGLDGLLQARVVLNDHQQQMSAISAGVDRWRADLHALEVVQSTGCVEWDGKTLRLTRRAQDGGDGAVLGVVWHWQDGQWQRWQSNPVSDAQALRGLWSQLRRWPVLQPGPDGLVFTSEPSTPVRSVSLGYYRFNTWTNPQSSVGVTSADNPCGVPDAIRLTLDLPGPAWQGPVSIHWLRPGVALGGV